MWEGEGGKLYILIKSESSISKKMLERIKLEEKRGQLMNFQILSGVETGNSESLIWINSSGRFSLFFSKFIKKRSLGYKRAKTEPETFSVVFKPTGTSENETGRKHFENSHLQLRKILYSLQLPKSVEQRD